MKEHAGGCFRAGGLGVCAGCSACQFAACICSSWLLCGQSRTKQSAGAKRILSKATACIPDGLHAIPKSDQVLCALCGGAEKAAGLQNVAQVLDEKLLGFNFSLHASTAHLD